jgi:hypothetical protein
MITNASANLEESDFDKLANSTFYAGEKLGWYVDFSVLSKAMKFEAGQTISKVGSGIRFPDDEDVFNSTGFMALSSTWGKIGMALDVSIRVDDPYNAYTYIDTKLQSSSGERPNIFDVFKKMYGEQSVRTVGGRPVTFDEKGRPIPREQSFLPMINPKTEPGEILRLGAKAMPYMAKFVSGMRMGYDLTNNRLPMWQIGDMNFFTNMTFNISSFERGIGASGGTWVAKPNYTPSYLAKQDQRIFNFNKYLSMPDGVGKTFTWIGYGLSGWK